MKVFSFIQLLAATAVAQTTSTETTEAATEATTPAAHETAFYGELPGSCGGDVTSTEVRTAVATKLATTHATCVAAHTDLTAEIGNVIAESDVDVAKFCTGWAAIVADTEDRCDAFKETALYAGLKDLADNLLCVTYPEDDTSDASQLLCGNVISAVNGTTAEPNVTALAAEKILSFEDYHVNITTTDYTGFPFDNFDTISFADDFDTTWGTFPDLGDDLVGKTTGFNGEFGDSFVENLSTLHTDPIGDIEVGDFDFDFGTGETLETLGGLEEFNYKTALGLDASITLPAAVNDHFYVPDVDGSTDPLNSLFTQSNIDFDAAPTTAVTFTFNGTYTDTTDTTPFGTSGNAYVRGLGRQIQSRNPELLNKRVVERTNPAVKVPVPFIPNADGIDKLPAQFQQEKCVTGMTAYNPDLLARAIADLVVDEHKITECSGDLIKVGDRTVRSLRLAVLQHVSPPASARRLNRFLQGSGSQTTTVKNTSSHGKLVSTVSNMAASVTRKVAARVDGRTRITKSETAGTIATGLRAQVKRVTSNSVVYNLSVLAVVSMLAGYFN